MSEPPDRGAADPRLSLAAAGCLYAAMLAGGLFWLWSRGRLGQLPEQAIGRRGLPEALAVGLAVGVAAAVTAALLARKWRFVREFDAEARRLFAPLAPAPLLAVVLVGAVAEELFFRLAAQDALGLFGSVAGYVLLHSSTAGWAWMPITALHGLVLGLLMQSGFGLLGTTVANAVMNHLCMLRILSK